jgi:hypothetical protein
VSTEIKETGFRQSSLQFIEISFAAEVNVRPIIETRAADGAFIGPEAESPDQVKRESICGAQPCDVTGIWVNLGPV